MRRSLLPAVVLLSCFALACGESPPASTDEIEPPDATEVIRELQREMDAASIAGDAERLAAIYAEDVILMPPGIPAIEGVDAVLEYFAAGRRPVEGQTDLLEVVVDGDLAWARGQYVATVMLPSGEAVTDSGKMLEVFRRGDDGQWRLWRDIWNSDRE